MPTFTTPYPDGQTPATWAGNKNYVLAMPETIVDGNGVTWAFAYWDDDPTPANPSIPATRTVYLDSDKSFLAHYVQVMYEISVDTAGISNVPFSLTPI